MSANKVKSLISSHWWVLLVALIVFLAYGQTLNMYFWVDDWGMAYKMRYIEADIPNFGAGLFGEGAYRYNTTPFALLYPLLGFNATAYFLGGLVFYFVAAICVFWLSWELTKNKAISLSAALIFASGYIGSYAMYRLSNSYQLIHTAIMMILVSITLIRHYKTGSSIYYWLSLLLFIATLEFLFLRSQGIIFLPLLVSAIYVIQNSQKSKILKFLLKQIPFLFVWYYFVFIDPRVATEYDGVTRASFTGVFIESVVLRGHFELLNNFLITFTASVIPDIVLFNVYDFVYSLFAAFKVGSLDLSKYAKDILLALPLVLAAILTKPLIYSKKKKLWLFFVVGLTLFFLYLEWSMVQESSLWKGDSRYLFISSIGGGLLSVVTMVTITNFRKAGVFILFALFWLVSNIIVYFIYMPTTNLASNSRYLIPAFVGSSLLFPLLISQLNFKFFSHRIKLALLIGLCGFLVYYSNKDEKLIVNEISYPTQNDLKVLRASVPEMDKSTLFYFETSEAEGNRFTDLGGIPHLAIPLALNYEGKAEIPLSYDEVIYQLSKGKVAQDNIYTFFSTKDSLIDTTEEFRGLLGGKKFITTIDEWIVNVPQTDKGEYVSLLTTSTEGTIAVNPSMEGKVKHPSLVPYVMKITMSAESISPGNLTFPYNDMTNKMSGVLSSELLSAYKPVKNQEVDLDIQKQTVADELDRLLSVRSSYSDSAVKSREADFMTDGSFYTSWEANTLKWRREKALEEIVVNYQDTKAISQLSWVNHNYMSTPTGYTIEVSSDGKNWKTVKKVSGGSKWESGELVVDVFPRVMAKYVKMRITDTYGKHPPGLDEVWANDYVSSLDQETRDSLLKCLYCFVDNLNEALEIKQANQNEAYAKISWQTDKNDTYMYWNWKRFLVQLDGKPHTYNFILPPQGHYLKGVKLDSFSFPVKIKIHSASLESLSFDDMVNMGIIHEFVE